VAALAKVFGSVDDLGRPVVRVEVPGHDGFLAVVDTGFNRSLMLTATEAQELGFAVSETNTTVELGTTARSWVRRGSGTIEWFGKTVTVDVLVSNEEASTHRADTARALLGTQLLAGCLLLVDFEQRTVEIEHN
jgi:predicted aspartyl protease